MKFLLFIVFYISSSSAYYRYEHPDLPGYINICSEADTKLRYEGLAHELIWFTADAALSKNTTATGSWFGVGTERLAMDKKTLISNYGDVKLIFNNDFSNVHVLFEVFEHPEENWWQNYTNRVAGAPSNPECFFIEQITKPISGIYNQTDHLGAREEDFRICQEDSVFSASYGWIDGIETDGYMLGKCFFGGRVCQSNWYEKDLDESYFGFGPSLLVQRNEDLYVVWWFGSVINALNITADFNNSFFHAIDPPAIFVKEVSDANICEDHKFVFADVTEKLNLTETESNVDQTNSNIDQTNTKITQSTSEDSSGYLNSPITLAILVFILNLN